MEKKEGKINKYSTHKELLSFVKNHDMDLQNANASIFAADFVFQAYMESEKITDFTYLPTFGYHVHSTNFYQLMANEAIRGLSTKVYQEAIKNISSYKKIVSESVSLENKLDAVWKKYAPIEKLSDLKLLELFNQIKEIGQLWWCYGVIGEDKGRIIDEEIVPIFEQNHNMSRTEANNFVSIITHPEKEAIFTGERREFYEFCLAYLNDNKGGELIKRFKKYQKKYFYSKSSFLDCKEITFVGLKEEVRKEIKEKGVEKIKAELAQIKFEKNNIHKEKISLLKKIKLSKEEKKNLIFASNLVEWLDYRKRGMMKQFYYLFSIMHEYSRRFNILYLSLCNMTADEALDVFSGKTKYNEQEILKRNGPCITVHERGCQTQIFYGEEATALFQVARKEDTNQPSQIKGSVASLGSRKEKKIIGIAKIIIDPVKEILNEGEILIASMTRIEFVPLMKKARAIITDEGGIACHAAIVSRELGVPCIIGTKVATRFIKNGDQVEIDLESGSIRILSK